MAWNTRDYCNNIRNTNTYNRLVFVRFVENKEQLSNTEDVDGLNHHQNVPVVFKGNSVSCQVDIKLNAEDLQIRYKEANEDHGSGKQATAEFGVLRVRVVPYEIQDVNGEQDD